MSDKPLLSRLLAPTDKFKNREKLRKRQLKKE
jgi:hypothetical protein